MGGLPNVASKKCVIAATSVEVVARCTGIPVGDGRGCGGFARTCEQIRGDKIVSDWVIDALCQKWGISLLLWLRGRKFEKKSRARIRVAESECPILSLILVALPIQL